MLDPVVNAARIVWEFYNAHKDPVNLLLTTAFSGFGLTGLNWWREKQQKRRRARIAGDSLPFRVVRPNGNVFPAIFGREESEYPHSALIDWKIPLQDRELGTNHLAEIIKFLNDDKWVIITGPTGIGKTREMAEVAHRFSRRGWTVMVFTGILEGDRFPQEQFQDVRRNVLFVFDDLHIQMRRSQPTRENRATEEQSLPTDRPLQERLLAALDHCDRFYIPDRRIKVLATARNEPVSDDPRLVSPWEMLQWERYPLWRRFKPYPLPKPENQAVASWLENVSDLTGVQLGCPPEKIAKRNDGTFQNLVNNFEILLAGDSQEGRSLSLSRENFKDTLRGSWEKCYQDAFKLEPLAKELYDAVDLLQQANIPLKAFVVERVALMLVRGNRWQKVRYQWRIKKALEKLEAREGILSPRDGQIEGKGELLSLEDYLEKLLGLFLALLDRFPVEVKEALDKVSNKLYDKENYAESLRGYDALVKYFPKDENFQLMRGNNLYYLVRYADALDCFNRATEIKPDYFRAWTNKGSTIQKVGVLEGVEKEATALEYFDRALAINPDDALTLVNKGLLLGELGKKEEALELYKQAINNDPNYYRAYYAQGLEFSEMNRYEESISAYAQAIEVKPDFVAAWVGKGNQLANLERYEEALSAYEEAIRLKPDYEAAWLNKGNQLANLGRYEEALSAYEEAIRLKPDYEAAWLGKGNQLSDLKRYEEALSAYDEAIRLKPDYEAAWNGKGNQLGNLGRYEEALSAYEEAIRLKPDYEATWNGKGNQLGNLGRYEEALSAYEEAIRLKPDYEAAWLGKGNQLGNLGRYEEALSAYEEAIRLKPDYDYAWNGKGNQLANLGRYEEALSAYDEAIRIVPNDPTPRLAKCSALVFLEQFLEALVCSDKLIEIDPEDITFLNIRAFLLGMNDNYMESKKIYQEILESNPNFLPAYFTSSIVKYKQEQYSQALDSISQCLMIEESNSQAWYMKAQILISLERFQEAFECFDRSLEIDSDYILCIYDKAYYQRLYGDYNKAISGFSLVIEHCQSELSRKKLDSNHWYVYCASLSYIKNYVLCLEQIAEALLRNPENAGIYFIIARHDALEENIDQSLANLKTAIKKSKHWQKAAIKEPDFDKIRQDPRFIELISDNF